jgi:hypothetical protein
LLEISQIRRSLVLLDGHQEPIPAQEIRVGPDDQIVVALGAGNTAPVRIGIGIAPIRLVDAPRPRQRIVEYGDFLVKALISAFFLARRTLAQYENTSSIAGCI